MEENNDNHFYFLCMEDTGEVLQLNANYDFLVKERDKLRKKLVHGDRLVIMRDDEYYMHIDFM